MRDKNLESENAVQKGADLRIISFRLIKLEFLCSAASLVFLMQRTFLLALICHLQELTFLLLSYFFGE